MLFFLTPHSTKDDYNARGEVAREIFLSSVMPSLSLSPKLIAGQHGRTF